MVTVVETKEYQNKSGKLVADKDERSAIINYLSEHPKSGDLQQGTGGVRKLRWAIPGKGKSGGVRIIYYYHDERMPLYLFTMFGKNEKDNLSNKEKNGLKKVVKGIVKAHGL